MPPDRQRLPSRRRQRSPQQCTHDGSPTRATPWQRWGAASTNARTHAARPPPTRPLPVRGAIRRGARLCRRYARALIQIPREPVAARRAATEESTEVPSNPGLKKDTAGKERGLPRRRHASATGWRAWSGSRTSLSFSTAPGCVGEGCGPPPRTPPLWQNGGAAPARRARRPTHSSRAEESLCKAMARLCQAAAASGPSRHQNAAHGLCVRQSAVAPVGGGGGRGHPRLSRTATKPKQKTTPRTTRSAQHQRKRCDKISHKNETTPSQAATLAYVPFGGRRHWQGGGDTGGHGWSRGLVCPRDLR